MKKRKYIFLFIILIFVIAACNKNKDVGDGSKKNTDINSFIFEPTPEISQNEVYEEGKTENPENDVDEKQKYELQYQDFLGTWYIVSGEIEGYEWTAVEEGDHSSITFNTDYTADYINKLDCWDNVFEYNSCPLTINGNENGIEIFVDTQREDCLQYFSLAEDGTLVEYDEIAYDGEFGAIAVHFYSRVEPEFPVYIPPIVPEEIQKYIDECPENCWMVAIANPSEELSSVLNEAGFNLEDESDNEWIESFERPMEIILANTYNKRVMIQVHEPASDYDPTSEEDGWVAGPFLYYADLAPGELWRFVIDTPEKPVDAKYAIYMVFYDEGTDYEEVTRKYYIRVYEFDHSFPYFSFE